MAAPSSSALPLRDPRFSRRAPTLASIVLRQIFGSLDREQLASLEELVRVIDGAADGGRAQDVRARVLGGRPDAPG